MSVNLSKRFQRHTNNDQKTGAAKVELNVETIGDQ
jgi:hypothetical protein